LVTNRSVVVATSSDPNPLTKWNFPSRLEPYAERFFSARPDRWELSTLAVHPDHQRRGVGQGLVAWGLDKAKADGLPAVVVAAQGTEPFYQTCGFAVEVGSVSKVELDDHVEDDGNKPEKRIDEKNPLKARGIQGGAVLWTE
jgi:GNAT superfamily N-acetyltransferase